MLHLVIRGLPGQAPETPQLSASLQQVNGFINEVGSCLQQFPIGSVKHLPGDLWKVKVNHYLIVLGLLLLLEDFFFRQRTVAEAARTDQAEPPTVTPTSNFPHRGQRE